MVALQKRGYSIAQHLFGWKLIWIWGHKSLQLLPLLEFKHHVHDSASQSRYFLSVDCKYDFGFLRSSTEEKLVAQAFFEGWIVPRVWFNWIIIGVPHRHHHRFTRLLQSQISCFSHWQFHRILVTVAQLVSRTHRFAFLVSTKIEGRWYNINALPASLFPWWNFRG